jgi:hypothetical protein
MSKLDAAMLEHVAYIVFSENRPFSYRDCIHFKVNGNEYKMSHGTYRNKILKLKKQGQVELAYNSGIVFYTLKGKKFGNSQKMMTADHAGVPSAIISQSILKAMPIYNWLKKQPMEKQSLHNIRLRFESPGLWNIFSKIYPTQVNPDNKDIMLPTSVYFDYLDVAVTIHHSDTVSVAISCSFRPIAIDIPDILPLCEALTRTEINLASSVENYSQDNALHSMVTIPRYTKWIVTMWHFGVDTIREYTGKEFEITFGEGISHLYRIYTRCTKDGKNRVRSERQEQPDQEYAEAIVRKLFPDGHLIGVGCD